MHDRNNVPPIKLLFFCILVLSVHISFARKADLSSRADTTLFREWIAEIRKRQFSDPKFADSLANAFFKETRALQHDGYAGEAAALCCVINLNTNIFSARAWYDKALIYLKKSNNHVAIGRLNMDLGEALTRNYDFENGIPYLLQSVTSFELAGDTMLQAAGNTALSNAFHDFGNYEKGKFYAHKAISLVQSSSAASLSQKWRAYTVLAINYDDNKEYHKALEAHFSALRYADNDLYLCSSYNNIGNTNKKNGNLLEASRYMEAALNSARRLNDYYQYATIFGNLGDINMKQHRYNSAARYIDSCIYYSIKSSSPEKLIDAYDYAYQLNNQTGNYRQAVEYLRMFTTLKDSLQSAEKAKIIYDSQERYEADKKDQQNKQLIYINKLKTAEALRAKADRRLIIWGSLLVLFASGLTFFIVYRNRMAKNMMEEEQLLTRTLFTGEQQERIRIARDLHDSIGQMLSVMKMNVSALDMHHPTATQTLQLIDRTIDEVRNISHNLMPEDLDFGLQAALESMADKINTGREIKMTIGISNEVEGKTLSKQTELSVYRIVQEVVNNMIKHANAKTINLFIKNAGQNMVLSISDNGQGFDPSIIAGAKGIGWKNIHARLGLLNGKLMVRSEKLHGTQIEITIPYQ